MKRIISILLLLSMLLLTVSCNSSDEDSNDVDPIVTTTSSDDDPDDPPDPIYVPHYEIGKVYYTYASHPELISSFLPQLPVSDTYVEMDENLPDVSWTINGELVVGTYISTQKWPSGKERHLYDCKYGMLVFDGDGELCALSYDDESLADLAASEADSEILTYRKCKNAAMDFLQTVFPEREIEPEYTLLYSEHKLASGTIEYYSFNFSKNYMGYQSDNSFTVYVTKQGNVFYFNRGERFDESYLQSLAIDRAAIELSVQDFLYSAFKTNSGTHEWKGITVRLNDGIYICYAGLTLTFDNRLGTGEFGDRTVSVTLAIPLNNRV